MRARPHFQTLPPCRLQRLGMLLQQSSFKRVNSSPWHDQLKVLPLNPQCHLPLFLQMLTTAFNGNTRMKEAWFDYDMEIENQTSTTYRPKANTYSLSCICVLSLMRLRPPCEFIMVACKWIKKNSDESFSSTMMHTADRQVDWSTKFIFYPMWRNMYVMLPRSLWIWQHISTRILICNTDYIYTAFLHWKSFKNWS